MNKRDKQHDLEDLERGRPYLRGILAFLLHLRFNYTKTRNAYAVADEFISELESDINKQEEKE